MWVWLNVTERFQNIVDIGLSCFLLTPIFMSSVAYETK